MSKAVSKPVEGLEVYQTDRMVCVGYGGGGVGSVFGGRTYKSQSAATRAYDRIETPEQAHNFAQRNPTSFP